MKTNVRIQHSIVTESDHIIEILVYLINGFYVKNGFIPVNKLIAGEKKSINFPPLTRHEYKQLSDLLNNPSETVNINEIQKLSKHENLDKIKKILNKILIQEKNNISKDKLKEIEENWNKSNDWFFDMFSNIFNTTITSLDLDIIVTSYGAYVMFSDFRIKDNKANVEIYIREDMGSAEIAEGIISSYISSNKCSENLSWSEIEAVSDTFMKMSSFMKIFPDYKATLDITRDTKMDKNILIASNNFLTEIGYKHKNTLEIKDNIIYIKNKPAEISFSPMERMILKLLIDKKNKMCTFLDIGNIIWDDPKKFSTWTITTLIYRIRSKLEKNGFPSDNLKTHRNKGFTLEA